MIWQNSKQRLSKKMNIKFLLTFHLNWNVLLNSQQIRLKNLILTKLKSVSIWTFSEELCYVFLVFFKLQYLQI